ncbi:MAG: 50S ribosomal protein L11 methyltransferase [Patescibacteria group bacterium]|nr:50S ribosomal protein L11 methyltransferase [Patescibacteria group bacterium]
MLGFIIHLGFGIFIFFLLVAFITGAPFVPSSQKTAKRMIELAGITSDSIIYDLGSGNGRLLLLASKRGGKKIIGIEINPLLVLFTKLRIFLSRRKHIHCIWGDFWRTDISDADIIFVYLLPWKMDKLAEKIKKETKPGTTIVSNSFIFPHWPIAKEDKDAHVYVFKT